MFTKHSFFTLQWLLGPLHTKITFTGKMHCYNVFFACLNSLQILFNDHRAQVNVNNGVRSGAHRGYEVLKRENGDKLTRLASIKKFIIKLYHGTQ